VDRPDWDSYFMTLCYVIAQRSIDPHTKHGSVIVSQDKTILSVGYNGPPRNCDDSQIPLTRPEKYAWLSHSEIGAITNAARTGTNINKSIIYITGYPCEVCFRSIINAGIQKVIYGPIKSMCVNKQINDVVEKMSQLSGINLYSFNNSMCCKTLVHNVLKLLG